MGGGRGLLRKAEPAALQVGDDLLGQHARVHLLARAERALPMRSLSTKLIAETISSRGAMPGSMAVPPGQIKNIATPDRPCGCRPSLR